MQNLGGTARAVVLLAVVLLLGDVPHPFTPVVPPSAAAQRNNAPPPPGSPSLDTIAVTSGGRRLCLGVAAAAAASAPHLPPSPTTASMAPATPAREEPLDRQLADLRRELVEVQAALTALAHARSDLSSSSSIDTGIGGDKSGVVDAQQQQQQQQRRDQWQQRYGPLEERLLRDEQRLRLEAAVALQQLNHQRPDGGSRLAEAEGYYRAVLASLERTPAGLGGAAGGANSAGGAAPVFALSFSPSSSSSSLSPSPGGYDQGPHPQGSGGGGDGLLARLGVWSNLAALLLDWERPYEALRELEAALREAEAGQLGGSSPALLCGLRFNRAKAMAAVGSTRRSEEAYAEAAHGAVGLDPACFAKSAASMSRLSDDLLPLVLSAVRLAEHSGLRSRLMAQRGSGGTAARAAAQLPERGGGGGGGKGGGGSSVAVPGGAQLGAMVVGGDAFGDLAAGGWLAGLSVDELGWLYFAAAKALDERGAEVEEAWSVLVKANDLLSSQHAHDPATDWRQLTTLTSVFTRPLMEAVAEVGGGLRRRGDGGDRPVFVVGLPRSGSTLVETMLSVYPGVWGAGEDTALAPLTTEINDMLASQGLSQIPRLADFGRRYLAGMIGRASVAGFSPERPPLRIVDKMLHNLWLLGYIQLLLPRSCLVHVVRHPLDVALSCYSQPFGYSGVPWAWKLEHIGEQIRMTYALAAHWARHLPAGRLLTLHYEELVAAPEASARRLLAHCGLDWDPAVLHFHKANRTVATASVAQVRQPLYSRSVGRWRKYEKQLAPLAAQVRTEVAAYEAAVAEAVRRAEAEQRRLDREAAAAAEEEAVAAAAVEEAGHGLRESSSGGRVESGGGSGGGGRPVGRGNEL